ncbi:cytochrome B [Rhizobiales bacterium]|uniref:cytochrome b n=1 Tax=Hongsoonwoonella zoysiae TaxID=2821844 RepID=UPI0015609FCD|nr:cytochrome b/b6 domain-containing protein [Hongsoonwoonella zoysiae]NRG16629.1 cytochrome B [Hongsoonwoonella zoysiae]
MKLRDTGLAFGVVTIACHWTGAFLLPGFLLLAVYTLAGSASPDPESLNTLTSLAFLCAVLFSFRIYWRLKHYHPMPLGGAKPVEVIIARCVAFGLLVAGVVLPLILWASLSASGHEFRLFGLAFPRIWSEGEASAFYLTGLFWLGVIAFTLGFLLHLFGAFKHQVILKDDAVLRLMGKKVEL